MKVLFNLMLPFLLMTGTNIQEKPLAAGKIMDDAFVQATRENKNVFVMFHASWCGWCHRMDSLMNVPETKDFFEKSFVIRHLVVGEVGEKKYLDNPGAAEMVKKYNGEKQGIPYWLIFNAKGDLLSDSRMMVKDKKTGKESLANTGCPSSPDEVKFFVGLLKKTTPLNDADLAIIAEKFTMKRVTH